MTLVYISAGSYLVDVAPGLPLACAVPLHALPFTTKCCKGITTEFRKVDDGEYAKVRIGEDFFNFKFVCIVTENLKNCVNEAHL
jgi:hypothetical protein